MKKVSLILFLSVLSNLLVAQSSIKFNKQYTLLYGLPNAATSIIPNNNGYIIYGFTTDSLKYSGTRVSITKIDSSGNLKWAKSYGKKGYDYLNIFTRGGHPFLGEATLEQGI